MHLLYEFRSAKKALLYGFLAMLVTLGFWVGGYVYFINSEDWYLVQKTISTSETVVSNVGPVKDVSVSLFGFSYRFSGEWGHAKLHLLVLGDKGEAKFEADLEKSKGKWTMIRINGVGN